MKVFFLYLLIVVNSETYYWVKIPFGFNLIPIYDVPLYHMSHEGMGNDGTNPTKQHYNDAWAWVETFDKYIVHDHIMYSRNLDTWGFSPIDIEYELI